MSFQRWLALALLLGLSAGLQAEEANKEAAPPAEAPPANTEAAAPTPEPERLPLLDRSTQQAQDLARQWPRQAKTLKAEEEEFLAFWQLSGSPQPSGAIVLLPGRGETPNWPRVIGPLWRGLPQYGWHTLSVSLPDPEQPLPERSPEPPMPAATPEGEKTAEAAPAETPPAAPEATAETDESSEEKPEQPSVPKRIHARIAAAVEFARNQGVSTVILMGHGTGAYWAAQHLLQENATQVQQLTLIAPQQPYGEDKPLEEMVALLTRQAISDFYYSDNPSDQAQAQLRREATSRARHPAYYQLPLKILPGDQANEQEQVVRRVRGWLERQVPRTL